jgi:hypothetical protein
VTERLIGHSGQHARHATYCSRSSRIREGILPL